MKAKHRPDPDRVFAKTMIWVCLAMLAILAIAYVSHVMHTPKEANQEQPALNSLADSVHHFEDGM